MTQIGQGSRNPVISPARFPFAIRTINSTTSLETGGRPAGPCGISDPSNFWAMSSRCPGQDRFRSGDDGDLRECLRPSRFAISASVDLWGSVSRKRSRQVRSKDTVLGNQVFVLQQQLLVHRAQPIRSTRASPGDKAKLVHRGYRRSHRSARPGTRSGEAHGRHDGRIEEQPRPMLSQPREVLDVIRRAAGAVT